MSKVEKALSWPESMLEHIKSEAARTDRSLSWCVQRAWQSTRDEIAALGPGKAHAGAEATCRERFAGEDTRQTTLFFPADMAKEIGAAAARQGLSESRLLQSAWCLAIPSIAKWPTTGD